MIRTVRRIGMAVIILMGIVLLAGVAPASAAGAGRPARSSSPDVMLKLSDVGAGLGLAVRHYDGNRLVSEDALAFEPSGTGFSAAAASGDRLWRAALSVEPAGRPAAGASVLAVMARVRLEKGAAKQTGAALRLNFGDWSTGDYVMIPAAAYNGNRFLAHAVKYPPEYGASSEGRPGMPPVITDVPKLNIGDGPSLMELTTGDMATPAFAVYFPARKKALLVLFTQGTELGDSGVTVEESADRRRASLVITAPAVRGRRYGDMTLKPSDDRAPDLKAGDEVTMVFQVHVFDCPDVAGLFRYFLVHRKDLTGPNTFEDRIPFSEALRMECGRQNVTGERWNEKGGYYKNGNGDAPFGHIQLGWVGGLMQTYPLIMSGDDLSWRRSRSTIDVVMKGMAGASGFFYGMYKNGRNFGDNFSRMEERPQAAMIRKNADVLHFMVKQFNLLKDMGMEARIDPLWEKRTRGLADAFCRLWERCGDFGQLVDVETGGLVIGGSTAGAMAPAALAMASRYFRDARYLRVAELSAGMYYRRDVARGWTTGGPGEILQCPDSESAFAMLESFVVLYEATGKSVWLERAEIVAGLCSSWVVSYDHRFPAGSDMDRIGAHSAGAVWASVQNKHSAPGICTASGDCLLKLYRATGNTLYLDLLRDIAHNILEFMSTARRPVGAGGDGYISERVNLSDWEGRSNVGGNDAWGSVTWCELAVMLTAAEIPGIYVRPDKGLVEAFDHLAVGTAKGGNGDMVIRIHNQTPYPSRFTVLVDNGRLLPVLNETFFLRDLPAFALEPGGEVTLTLDRSGKLKN